MFSTRIGAVDAFGKAGEIFDQRGERKLAAGFMAVDHEGLQVGARGIDGRGIAGAAGADDDDVLHGNFMLANDGSVAGAAYPKHPSQKEQGAKQRDSEHCEASHRIEPCKSVSRVYVAGIIQPWLCAEV